MKITVNGEHLETAATTLGELCNQLKVADKQVATARNGEFVPATTRAATVLAEGDRIELLSPRQGG